jgi:hypothetical protein
VLPVARGDRPQDAGRERPVAVVAELTQQLPGPGQLGLRPLQIAADRLARHHWRSSMNQFIVALRLLSSVCRRDLSRIREWRAAPCRVIGAGPDRGAS